jgi:hypothetical protein
MRSLDHEGATQTGLLGELASRSTLRDAVRGAHDRFERADAIVIRVLIEGAGDPRVA